MLEVTWVTFSNSVESILQPYLSKEDYEIFKLLKEIVELTERSGNSISGLYVKILHCLRKMEKFFGQQFNTIKSHLLEHKAEDYQRFGPNWTHSTFQLEDYGGRALNLKTSNTNFEETLCW